MKQLTGKIIFYRRPSIGTQVDIKPNQLFILGNFLSSHLRSLSGLDFYVEILKKNLEQYGVHEGCVASNTGEIHVTKTITKFAEDFFNENPEQDFYLETDLFFEIISLWRKFLTDKHLDSYIIDVEALRAMLIHKQ